MGRNERDKNILFYFKKKKWLLKMFGVYLIIIKVCCVYVCMCVRQIEFNLCKKYIAHNNANYFLKLIKIYSYF